MSTPSAASLPQPKQTAQAPAHGAARGDKPEGASIEALAAELTAKQKALVDTYCETLNQTEAARRVYNFSTDNAAASHASKTLRKHKVRAYLRAVMDEVMMDAAEVIARLSNLARTSAADFVSFDEDGRAQLDLEKASKRAALSQVRDLTQHTTTKGDGTSETTLDVRLADPQRALKALAKILELTGGADPEAGGASSASEQALKLVQQKVETHYHT